MTNRLLLLLAFLLFSLPGFTQQITIGSGQFRHADNLYGPMVSNATDSLYNRHCYIYSAQFFSNLSHGDLIRSIGFNHSTASTNPLTGNPTFRIWFNQTTMSTYGADSTPINWNERMRMATKVYDGDPSSVVDGTGGYNYFTLLSPYSWDTTKGLNFELIVEYEQKTGQTQLIQWLYDRADATPGLISGQTKWLSGTWPSADSITTGGNLRHPNISLTYPQDVNISPAEMSSISFLHIGEHVVPKIFVENTGRKASGIFSVSLNTGSGYNSMLMAPSIATGSSAELVFDTLFAPMATVSDEFIAISSLGSDTYARDDTLRQKLEVYDPHPTGMSYVNGPSVNRPGGGFGGHDESIVVDPIDFAGNNVNSASGFRMADDFTVPEGASWVIDSIIVYAYQTGSPMMSTFTAGYFRILNGPPNDPQTQVLHGDTLISAMFDSYWSGIYRVFTTQDTTRPLMRNAMVPVASLPNSLGPNTYWLEYSLEGSLASGPWANPITVDGIANTGNALHRGTNWVWDPLGGGDSRFGYDHQQGTIFEIYASPNVGIEKIEEAGFSLFQNYPNPFEHNTWIWYDLDETAEISLEIRDSRGRVVHAKDFGRQHAGEYKTNLNLSHLSQGIYLGTIQVDGHPVSFKMIKTR